MIPQGEAAFRRLVTIAVVLGVMITPILADAAEVGDDYQGDGSFVSSTQNIRADSESVPLLFDCFAAEGSPYYPGLRKIFDELFYGLGYHAIFKSEVVHPEFRGALDSGETDGSCARIKILNHELIWPEMKFLSNPVAAINVSVWGVQSPRLFEHLLDSHIGFLSSAKFNIQLLSTMGFKNVIPYESAEALAQDLLSGRIDSLLSDESLLGFDLVRDELFDAGLHVYERIAKFEAFPLLHEKHEGLRALLNRRVEALTALSNVEHGSQKRLKSAAVDEALPKIVFTCSLKKDSPAFGFMNELYSAAFRLLGYQFAMEAMPYARQTSLHSQGLYDGVCAKPRGDYSELQPDQLMIDYVLLIDALQLWGNRPQPFIDDMFSLPQGTVVAVIKGLPLGGDVLSKLRQQGIKIVEASNPKQLVHLLSSGEVDYILSYKTPIVNALNIERINSNLTIVAIGEQFEISPYLSSTNKHLVEDFSRALKSLRRSATSDLLIRSNAQLVYGVGSSAVDE